MASGGRAGPSRPAAPTGHARGAARPPRHAPATRSPTPGSAAWPGEQAAWYFRGSRAATWRRLWAQQRWRGPAARPAPPPPAARGRQSDRRTAVRRDDPLRRLPGRLGHVTPQGGVSLDLPEAVGVRAVGQGCAPGPGGTPPRCVVSLGACALLLSWAFRSRGNTTPAPQRLTGTQGRHSIDVIQETAYLPCGLRQQGARVATGSPG